MRGALFSPLYGVWKNYSNCYFNYKVNSICSFLCCFVRINVFWVECRSCRWRDDGGLEREPSAGSRSGAYVSGFAYLSVKCACICAHERSGYVVKSVCYTYETPMGDAFTSFCSWIRSLPAQTTLKGPESFDRGRRGSSQQYKGPIKGYGSERPYM